MRRPVKIAPSVLASDFARLGEEVRSITAAGCDYVHLDIMDGHFTPNITFGPPVVKALRRHSEKPFDTHLMITSPQAFLDGFAKAGSDIITVHPEAEMHLDRCLHAIRDLGKKAGVALNPSTPETVLEYVIDALDMVLVMTVNPGFGGQSFLKSQISKIARVHQMIGERAIDLEVDGGIDPETVKLAARAGANVFVAGTSVFRDDYAARIRAIREAAASA